MNKSIKILLIIVITLLCGAAGFFVTALVKTTIESKTETAQVSVAHAPAPVTAPAAPATAPAAPAPAPATAEPAIPESTPEPEEPTTPAPVEPAAIEPTIISVSKPVYDPSTKLYSFEVKAEGQNLTYVLADANGTKISSQKTGSFKVQPCKKGQYRVYVTDENGKRSSKKLVSGFVIVYEKLTKEEMQTAFNTGDYMQGDKLDFKHRISGNCVYIFNGLKEEEDKPTSYSEIFNRIGLATWKSVTVDALVYDSASNQVKRMTLTVNY